ncbi:MAG: EF-P lysine aminoacylase EpmA [Planctomycetia bacterium]|nr:EF-P lysine aminoacylase EpmA [Planctomycetia bacterium]
MFQDFRPTASLETLQKRAVFLQKTRNFFQNDGFLEVETPLLSADTVIDRHLDPMTLNLHGKTYYLQTSPEFGMKRLLATFPTTPIFQICKVFRRDECGTLHNPEFTMLEYYAPGDDYAQGMARLDALQNHLLGKGPAERLTYTAAFERIWNIHPLSASIRELAEIAQKEKLVVPEGFDTSENANRDDWLDFLLGEKIQPTLGFDHPVLLHDFPASQAALAVSQNGIAERFELYVNGIELANGYHELCDPRELRRRNNIANALRRLDGKEILPDDSRLLAAMESGLPPCAGTAVGMDRMFLLAENAPSLNEVLAFPFFTA